MSKLYAYLTFDLNCREAMTFYQECLGGELIFQTVGESPLSEELPENMKNAILHATLSKDSLTLMATDCMDDSGWIQGNAVSLMLDCSSEEEIRNYYEKLSQGGKQTHPLNVSFWGALVGYLTDRFGNHWLLHYPKNTKDQNHDRSI